MVYLPDIMKNMRIDNGFSQAKVSHGLGLSPQSYNRYEKGDRKPNLELIYGLAKFYNVSVIHFLAVVPTKEFIPEHELNKLPRWMQIRKNHHEYSLFDIAYQFEEIYLKTNSVYRKFRNAKKNISKKSKRENKKFNETAEIKKLREEYESLREQLSYYQDTFKMILSEKMKNLINS